MSPIALPPSPAKSSVASLTASSSGSVGSSVFVSGLSGLSWSARAASSRLSAVSPAAVKRLTTVRPSVRAETVTLPPVASMPASASATNASTLFSISLKASDRPIETATPAVAPKPTASEAATATASMPDESAATMCTALACTPSAPSPSM